MTYRRKSTRKKAHTIHGHYTSDLDDTNTEYMPLAGRYPTIDSVINRTYFQCAGTLSNLFVKLTGAAGAGKSYTLTLRVNGVDTSVAVTISGAADTEGEDSADSVHVSKGDYAEYKIVPAGTPTARDCVCHILFTPD